MLLFVFLRLALLALLVRLVRLVGLPAFPGVLVGLLDVGFNLVGSHDNFRAFQLEVGIRNCSFFTLMTKANGYIN